MKSVFRLATFLVLTFVLVSCTKPAPTPTPTTVAQPTATAVPQPSLTLQATSTPVTVPTAVPAPTPTPVVILQTPTMPPGGPPQTQTIKQTMPVGGSAGAVISYTRMLQAGEIVTGSVQLTRAPEPGPGTGLALPGDEPYW